MLSEEPKSFSEMLEALEISSSHLTYHLENLGRLVSKTADGKYKLSEFGEAAITTMSKAERAPRVMESKHAKLPPRKWKLSLVALLTALVIVSSVCYVQYWSLNRISAEYEQLKELMELAEKEGASIQSKYTLGLRSRQYTFKTDSNTTQLVMVWPQFCVIYNPYDNSTLYLVLSITIVPPEFHVPISVQMGNVLSSATNETSTPIWSVNATESKIYSVPLPSKGWYTFGIGGQLTKLYDEAERIIGYKYKLLIAGFENIRCSMSLRILYDKRYVPFVVAKR
jgi:hypothetical protein